MGFSQNKPRPWGIKSKVTIAVLLLVLLSASTSCAWFGGGKGFVDLMKMVPVDSTSFSYWAIGKLAGDEDLWDIYEKFRESTEATQLIDIGVALASVKHSAKAVFDGRLVTLLSGDFDIKDIEGDLEKKGYQKSSWQEVGIWTPQDEQYKSMTLQKGTILVGDVEDLKACIDTIVKEQEYPLYEDPNIKLVTGKLPDGVVININKAGQASEEKYTDLIAYGKSYNKEDKGKLKLTAIYMFQDSYAAGQAQDEIKDYLETKGSTDVEAKREENFIRATGLIYIDAFVETLTF